jgi:hypothetical protein
MTILDTNVVSELLKPEPSAAVLKWMEGQTVLGRFTTSVSQAELLYGVELMPRGRRRVSLENAIRSILATDFGNRVLAFDAGAADVYGKIFAKRRSIGRPISQADAQIAAIVRSHPGATLATRNTKDFADCGIKLVNPWIGSV